MKQSETKKISVPELKESVKEPIPEIKINAAPTEEKENDNELLNMFNSFIS